ncbi:hypothetical protein J6590_059677 [Homalodisca vitripennis]|nr:hypothetical protein J6590_059677 [Homalodisca vitripennis]
MDIHGREWKKNCLTCILMGLFKLAYMDIHVCPRTSWTRPHRSLSERSAWNIRVDAHAQSTHSEQVVLRGRTVIIKMGLLIDEVRQRRALWDIGFEDYRNSDLKEKAGIEIASNLGKYSIITFRGETNVPPLDDHNIQVNNVEVNIDEELIDQGDNEENFGLPEDGQEL